MFANILLELDQHGIKYEHVVDDESDSNEEFVLIDDTDLYIEAENYLNGVYYNITERGYGYLLGLVSENCMCKVVATIIDDYLGQSNGRV